MYIIISGTNSVGCKVCDGWVWSRVPGYPKIGFPPGSRRSPVNAQCPVFSCCYPAPKLIVS